MIYDLIIIGGGVIGSAIARELSRYELATAFVEKEEELAFGVSKSNSGIIHPGTQNPPDALKGKLCVEGNRLIRGIADELGVDFKEVGELIVAFSPDEIVRLHQLKKEAEQLGVEGLKIVDRTWLGEHEPNLNPEARAALYAPTAGIISPYRLTYDMSENARTNGVEIYLSRVVESIRRDKAVFEVATNQGMMRARFIVNAAGLYADEVARMVGINDITIRPRKGEEFIFDKKKENLSNHLLFPLPTAVSKGVLIIKTADGNPMIGPTAQDVDTKEDTATTEAGFQQVMRSAQRLLPSLHPQDIIAYFAGLRPVAGNDFIIRHEKTVPGFITVAGIQSPGLTAAPAIACMVRRLLSENGLALTEKKQFHRQRTKTIHLFDIPLEETEKLIAADASYGDIVCRCEMVSAKEINDAIDRGATTLDGIKFRTRAQAGRCHGGFCTTRIMKILAEKTGRALKAVTKRGGASMIIMGGRGDD